jgi:hypothetical protein
MDEDDDVALDAATDKPATDQVPETEGQDDDQDDQPADAHADGEDETKTRSKERRERRKAHEQKLKEDAASARREAVELRRQNEQLLARVKGKAPPREDDPDDPFGINRALHKQREEDANERGRELEERATDAERRAQALAEERMRTRMEAYGEQRAEAKKSYADFDDVIAVASRSDVVAPHIAEMVIESDQAADVAYYLGKNPALARQISQMAPLEAARELGRIEARVTRPKPRTETTAPDPIAPVRGKASAGKDPDKMTPQEWRTWRESGGKV